MKSIKKVVTGSVAASMLVAGGLGMSSVATAGELAASVAVSNMYLFRGFDLGTGAAAVSGDLSYSTDIGLYGGLWVSSGDTTFGSEYDYFGGWAGEFGGLGVDVGLINYNYSGTPGIAPSATNGADDDTTGEYSELYLMLSYAGFDVSYWDNIAGEGLFNGADSYTYWTAGYTYDKYSLTYGSAQIDQKTTGASLDYAHVDFGYAYNDNLSFTFSQIIDDDTEVSGKGGYDDDLKIALTYSMPIE